MPRKTRPRWNHNRGYQGRIPPVFTPAEAGRLANTAGCTTAADIKKFADRLLAVSTAIEPLRYLQGPDVRPSEVKAALRELNRYASKLREMLDGTDSITLGRIRESYSHSAFSHEWNSVLQKALLRSRRINVPPPSPNDLFERDLKQLGRLASAIQRAERSQAAGAGRPRLRLLKEVAGMLAAEVWEWPKMNMGEFTISRKRGSDSAAKFLEAALKIIERKASASSIETALRHARTFARQRRSEAKYPPCPG